MKSMILALLLIVSLGSVMSAEEMRDIPIEATTPATSVAYYVTATIKPFDGWIEGMGFDLVTAATTTDVSIAVQPTPSTIGAKTIFSTTGAIADIPINPLRAAPIMATGAVISNSIVRIPVTRDDTISMTLTNYSRTGVVFRAVIREHVIQR